MAVFVEVTTDAFEGILEGEASQRTPWTSEGLDDVRRPTRGLEIKEDTPAALKVIGADGKEIPLVNSSSSSDEPTSSAYSNFLIQQVQEARMEKHQIVETFGESYIFFFGESPRFLDVSVILINSFDFNWEAEWWANYEQNFRGTKLVERGARLYMFYDDNVVEGYMLNAQATKVSSEPFLVNLSFRMYVTSYRNVTFVGDVNYPIKSSVAQPLDEPLRDIDSLPASATALHGEALSAAQADNLPDGIAVHDAQDVFAGKSALTRLLRAAPRSGAFPPETAQFLEDIGGADFRVPLRGRISDNSDEYLGPGGLFPSIGELPPAHTGTTRTTQEVEDLWLAAISSLACYGADVNNGDSLTDMGLMPAQTEDPGAPATFRPIPGVPFETTLTTPGKADLNDPLGAVFGTTDDGLNDRKDQQGAGDKSYGFNSSFGRAPGVGKPGYGDYGGNGFGGGQGEQGDPGFKDPEKFSFAGVSTQAGPFSGFQKPTFNSTIFGEPDERIPLSASSSGLSGGPASKIEGVPSAFSLTSSEGTLDPTAAAGLPAIAGVPDCPPTAPPLSFPEPPEF